MLPSNRPRHRVPTDDWEFGVYHRRNNTKSLNGRHAWFMEEYVVQLEKITVNIRLQERLGAIKAFADVLLHFGDDGWLRIDGFSIVLHPEKPASVVPPGNKGKRIMFDVILLKGKIERSINTAVMDQYNAALARLKREDQHR